MEALKLGACKHTACDGCQRCKDDPSNPGFCICGHGENYHEEMKVIPSSNPSLPALAGSSGVLRADQAIANMRNSAMMRIDRKPFFGPVSPGSSRRGKAQKSPKLFRLPKRGTTLRVTVVVVPEKEKPTILKMTTERGERVNNAGLIKEVEFGGTDEEDCTEQAVDDKMLEEFPALMDTGWQVYRSGLRQGLKIAEHTGFAGWTVAALKSAMTNTGRLYIGPLHKPLEIGEHSRGKVSTMSKRKLDNLLESLGEDDDAFSKGATASWALDESLPEDFESPVAPSAILSSAFPATGSLRSASPSGGDYPGQSGMLSVGNPLFMLPPPPPPPPRTPPRHPLASASVDVSHMSPAGTAPRQSGPNLEVITLDFDDIPLPEDDEVGALLSEFLKPFRAPKLGKAVKLDKMANALPVLMDHFKNQSAHMSVPPQLDFDSAIDFGGVWRNCMTAYWKQLEFYGPPQCGPLFDGDNSKIITKNVLVGLEDTVNGVGVALNHCIIHDGPWPTYMDPSMFRHMLGLKIHPASCAMVNASVGRVLEKLEQSSAESNYAGVIPELASWMEQYEIQPFAWKTKGKAEVTQLIRTIELTGKQREANMQMLRKAIGTDATGRNPEA